MNKATSGINTAARAAADGTDELAAAARRAQGDLQKTANRMREVGERMQEVGRQGIVLGALLAAPGIAAAGLAIRFESAFAGVRKTVDATEAEFAVLREGILDLSEEMPAAANEIAGVAEAAGQLGVRNSAILTFTETMIQLGETTNLSANEAATALARFANIIQFPQEQVDRLGAVIVDLGNNSATTEAEIVNLGLRIAGAGNIVGLSADEILSFAAALSSVGVRAEAGGTAISRTFVEIAAAVDGGGEKLARFAEVAGQSAEDFAAAFERDAAGATIAFIEGLGRIDAAGGSTFAVLEELSLGDNRLRDALLRAAGAGDLFRRSMAIGATALEENSALTEEFNRRIETTAAQLSITGNQIKRELIDIGTDFLPVILGAARGVQGLVDLFGALPAPLRTGAIAFGLVTGGVVALSGAMLILIGSLVKLGPTLLLGTRGLRGFQAQVLATQATVSRGFVGGMSAGTAAVGGFRARLLTATPALLGFRAALAFLTGPTGLLLLGTTVLTAGLSFLTMRDNVSEATDELEAFAEAADKAAGTATPNLEQERTSALVRREAADVRLAEVQEDLRPAEPGAIVADASQAGDVQALRQEEEKLKAEIAALNEVIDLNSAALRLKGLAENKTTEELIALAESERNELELLRDRRSQIEASIQAESSRGVQTAQSAARIDELRGELSAVVAEEGRHEQALREVEAAQRIVESSALGATGAIDAESDAFARNTNEALANAEAQRLAAAARDRANTLQRAGAAALGRGDTDLAIAFGFDPFDPSGELTGGALRPTLTAEDAEAFLGALDDVNTARRRSTTGLQGHLDALDKMRSQIVGTTASTGSLTRALTELERAQNALAERQERERAEAILREELAARGLARVGPGQAVGEVVSEQRRLDALFAEIAPTLEARLGVVPELFREMFEEIVKESEQGAERAERQIGGLLGVLIARRLASPNPGGGIIAAPGVGGQGVGRGSRDFSTVVTIENVNVGTGAQTTVGEIQQGVGGAVRGALRDQ